MISSRLLAGKIRERHTKHLLIIGISVMEFRICVMRLNRCILALNPIGHGMSRQDGSEWQENKIRIKTTKNKPFKFIDKIFLFLCFKHLS